jgi:hypothetical protein
MSQLRRAISPGVVLVAERDCLTPRTLNTLQLALLCYTTYYFLVLCYGESDELAVSIWSLNLEIAPSVIATFMVRCFFTVRLWHLSQGNRTLICTIMAFAFPQLGIGLGMCVASCVSFLPLNDAGNQMTTFSHTQDSKKTSSASCLDTWSVVAPTFLGLPCNI